MNKFKYFLLTAFLVVSILPGFAGAITVEEILAQIAVLQKQIEQLKTQAASMQTTAAEWCHDFNMNLRVGDSGNEVIALQTALSKNGDKSWEYKGYDGVFDEMTASAIVAFQQKYADEVLTPVGLKYGTGFVGPSTRAKLNKLYGCKTTQIKEAGLTIYSPSAGTVFQPDNRLIKISGFVNGNGWVGFEGYAGSVTLIDANGTEINNAFLLTTTDWTKIPVYFDAELSASGIKTDTGWLVFKSENPSGLSVNSREYRMPVSFKFITTPPSITVLSPNGGEVWTFGTPQKIKWATSGIASGKTFGLYLMATNNLMCHIATVDALAGAYAVTLQENQACSNPYFPKLVAGQYKVSIDAASATGIENSGDASDAVFSIIAKQTPLILGDVNENGRVDIGDALFIAQYVEGKRSLSAAQLTAADVNKDGKVSTNDAKIISQYDVKLYTALPVNVIVGDVNQNNRIDIGDSLFIAQYLAGSRTLGTIQEASADVNNDNKITQADADTIAAYLVGKWKELPIPYVSTETTNLPDLIISDFSWTPSNPKSVENITVSVKVKNTGSAAAQNFSVTNLWDSNGKEINISSLAAGGETTVTGNIGGLSHPGPNAVTMSVDALNKVVESNEANNSLNKTINVSPTYVGDGLATLKHWETWQLNNGYILYADGANVFGQLPYKVNFKIYDPKANYQVVATSPDLKIGESWFWSPSDQSITIKVNSINVGSYGNANWSAGITASSVGVVSSVATDSDNSPDYNKGIPGGITQQTYPDLFVAGVGKGIYAGATTGYHLIYGSEPNPLTTTDNYSTYYDYCVNLTQLNEAFVQSDGKLGAAGVPAPNGYICDKGKFIPIAVTSLLLGDVNSNGRVDIGDSLYIAQYLDNLRQLTSAQLTAADVNKDGKVTKADADVIAAHLVGKAVLPYTPASGSGDVNKDASVNVGDSLLITQYVNGTKLLDSIQLVAADVNSDGKVTKEDADVIAAYLVGKVAKLPEPIAITVLSPGNGDAYTVGSLVVIKWRTSNDIQSNASVGLFYKPDGASGKGDIIQVTSNNGSYNWNIPLNIVSGHYRIHMEYTYSGGKYKVEGESQPFSIVAVPTAVSSPKLNVYVSAIPISQNIFAGSQNVTFANYILDAGQSSENVRLTSMQLSFSDTSYTNDLTACALYDGNTVLNTGLSTISTLGDGIYTFVFDIGSTPIITKGYSKTLALKCNVSPAAKGSYSWGLVSNAKINAVGMSSANSAVITTNASSGNLMTIAPVTTTTSTSSIPPAPTGLSASVLSNGMFSLSWSDNSSNETGFKIEQKEGAGGSWSVVHTSIANVHSASFGSAKPNVQYYFRIKAYNAGGESAYSGESGATMTVNVPIAPSYLSAVLISSSQINLAWNDNSANENGFVIEYKQGETGIWATLISNLSANNTSYSVAGLNSGIVYYFRVKAYNSAGESAYSNEAWATTQGSISGTTDTTSAPLAIGDVTKDGKVSIMDSLYIAQYVVGQRTLDSSQLIAADVNTDGKVTNEDADVIAKYGVGKITALPAAYNIPSTPTGLSVSKGVSSGGAPVVETINLAWTDKAGLETGYKVERKTGSGGAYAEIASLSANSAAYSQAAPVSAVSAVYYYRVKAYSSSDSSGYSNEVSIIIDAGVGMSSSNQMASVLDSMQAMLSQIAEAIKKLEK